MTDNAEAKAGVFERLLHWKEYRRRAPQVFPSDHALRWFIRRHQDTLVQAGALMKLANGTYIDPVPFSALALDLMQVPPVVVATASHERGSP